jgi:hypothetical protein
MPTTTNQGVAIENNVKAALHFDTPEDAAESFLKGWEDEDNQETDSSLTTDEDKTEAQEPQQQEEEESEDSDDVESDEDDTDPEEESDETEDEDSEEDTEDKTTLEDDSVVEIKVDDEVLKVSVKDLKRLYGQEAALTKKSQQVAAKRKELEQDSLKTAAILDKMYKKAEERWKPYSEIDMLVASKQLDTDQFTALRAEAQAAWEDFKFVSEEAEHFLKESQTKQQEQLKTAAAESVKTLKQNIPNWNSNLYDSIREYAVSQGMPSDMVNSLVDPVAIQIIHKARLYDEGKKIATKKKVSKPQKIMKSTKASDPKAMASNKQLESQQKLSRTGDIDDAADLFLSRWADN